MYARPSTHTHTHAHNLPRLVRHDTSFREAKVSDFMNHLWNLRIFNFLFYTVYTYIDMSFPTRTYTNTYTHTQSHTHSYFQFSSVTRYLLFRWLVNIFLYRTFCCTVNICDVFVKVESCMAIRVEWYFAIPVIISYILLYNILFVLQCITFNNAFMNKTE